MKTERFKLQVSESIGAVSAEYIAAEESTCIITLAHGAGAGMDHPFMISLATALGSIRIATLRFNFPFIEYAKKRADVPAVAHKTVEAAIQHACDRYPKLPLFASGKSFGGRMSSQFLALHPSPFVNGIIFYGFPLHPAGKPSIERAEHLKDLSMPMLFLQGTRDELATLNLIGEVCSKLPKARLVKIEGADHGFKAGKEDIIRRLADETTAWLKSLSKGEDTT